MSTPQVLTVDEDAVDDVQFNQPTKMIDILHRPSASSQYTLLYRAPKDMLATLSGHFHSVLIEHGESSIYLTSGERAAYLGVLKWLTTLWSTGHEDSLHMGLMSVYKYMRLRYMTRELDCPSLTDFIARKIAFLLKCDMLIEEMDTILEWTAHGDEDWEVVVEYAATQLFKKQVHMDDYYDLFEKYGGFLDDVKKAVEWKRDERDEKVPPPTWEDEYYNQRTYWDFVAEQKKQEREIAGAEVVEGGGPGVAEAAEEAKD